MDIDHSILGHLEYDDRLDMYSTKVVFDGQLADLRLHNGGALGEPPSILHAVRIASNIDQLGLAAKECAVIDLLELKNQDWREEDEAEVTGDEFKRPMRLEGIIVYTNGRAEFFYLDGDLFWGHCILVQMDAGGRFDNAHIAG